MKSPVSSIVIVTAAVSILFLPVLFFNYTLIPQNPGDVISGLADRLEYHAADPVGSFTELSYENFLKQTLLSGHIPFWSPFQALGHPLLADTLFSALFAPATALRLLLPSAQWGIICVLNALLGSLSIYFLCRAYGCTDRAAVVGGITYLAVGTTVLYICVFSVTSVAVWSPLFILGIERLVALPNGNRKADYACAIAGAYGVITGGHVSITLLTLVLAAIYCATRMIQLRSLAGCGRVALAGAVAVMITAVHWLPFVEYAAYRGNTYGNFIYARFSWYQFPAFFLPYLYGHLNNALTDTTPQIEISRCWSLGWLPTGVLPLFLAGAISLVHRRAWKTGPFALALTAAVMALVAFNVPPFNLFYQLPFVGRIRGLYVPVTAGLVVCVVTALGFSRIEQHAIRLRAVAAWTFAVLAAALLACGAFLLGQHVGSAGTTRYLMSNSGYSLLWAAASLLAIAAASRPRSGPNALFAVGVGLPLLSAIAFFPWASTAAIASARETALGCFLIASVVAYFTGAAPGRMALGSMAAAALVSRLWVMTVPHHLPAKHDLFQTPAYAGFLQRNVGPGYRAYGLDGFLFPNLGSAYGISTPNRVAAVVTLQDDRFYRRYLDTFQAPEQFTGINDVSGGSPVLEFNRHRRFWDYLGVRYLVLRSGAVESNATGVAVYRQGAWYFTDSSESISGGVSGDVPIALDWNGNGRVKAGVFRGGLWLDPTDPQHRFHFGRPGDIPVLGDWNGDGRVKAGFFRDGLWSVDWNGDHGLSSRGSPHSFHFGQAGDIPVAGDWNGDGRVKAGVYRDGLWVLDWNGNGQWDATDAQHIFSFGRRGDIPITGDWNGDGRVKAGVFRDGLWVLDWNGNGQWDATDAQHMFLFGQPGDVPIVWRWGPSERRPAPLAPAFEDKVAHALILKNRDAQMRAYLAPETETAADWQQAQDRFASQPALRKTAFVEQGGACVSTDSSPEQMGRVSALRMEANRVEMDVEAHHAGMLVLVDAFMPGWTARVDDRPTPVVRVNGTFRGACIGQSGNHRVVMEYQPPHWHFAVGLSATGVGLFAGLVFLRRRSLPGRDFDPWTDEKRRSPVLQGG